MIGRLKEQAARDGKADIDDSVYEAGEAEGPEEVVNSHVWTSFKFPIHCILSGVVCLIFGQLAVYLDVLILTLDACILISYTLLSFRLFCWWSQEDVAKPEQNEEDKVADQEPDKHLAESPPKSYHSEEEDFDWSEYKSEL